MKVREVARAIVSLKSQLGSERVLSSGRAYEEARHVWNAAVELRPEVIVLCEDASHVQCCVRVATETNLSLSVKSRGNDWPGRAMQGDLVIDLTRMRSVEVKDGVAVVGGGATALDVATKVQSHGLVAVTGNVGSVGMAGLAMGGGYGPLTAAFGMASDSLVGADVVTADGRLIRTDKESEPELLWALRGGGGNFGVVTQLHLKLHPVDFLSTGTIVFPWDQASAVLQKIDQSSRRSLKNLR